MNNTNSSCGRNDKVVSNLVGILIKQSFKHFNLICRTFIAQSQKNHSSSEAG